MTQAPLQIDFRPQPRGIAVVTSAPISSIIENGRYSAFQDLVDGYASSFAKVIVVSPSGELVIPARQAVKVSWLSGPGWLSPMNGLWWAAIANRSELREVELVRTFGPQAGVVGRALSRLSDSPHVASADDLTGNTWRDETGWRAIVPALVNRLGVLRADVLSATLDWEIEYLAETGYQNDLLLGSRGLPTDIYTPVGLTDPDRHPVVMWAGNITGDDSAALVAQVASSTREVVPDVEFIVIAQGDAAERMRSSSVEQALPVTVASLDEVEPLVDLVGRTWACVTVPGTGRGMPHGLAMLALSAGIPLVSVGELGEVHGFQNHLNYICVKRSESEEVAYSLQLLRRWANFALRIGASGQKLVEERYSNRSVALVEGSQLARIAAGLDVGPATADGASALREFTERRVAGADADEATAEYSSGVEGVGSNGDGDPGASSESEQTDATATRGPAATGFDLVAAAVAAANGKTRPAGEPTDENTDLPQTATGPGPDTGVPADKSLDPDEIAALFAEIGVSTETVVSSGQSEADDEREAGPEPAPGPVGAPVSGRSDAAKNEDGDEGVASDDDPTGAAPGSDAPDATDGDGLPQITLIKVNVSDISPGDIGEGQATEADDGPVPDEDGGPDTLDGDAIAALIAASDDAREAA